MKPAVLDKYFVRVLARYDDAGQIDTERFTLKSVGIGTRFARRFVESDTVRGEKVKIGVIARHGEDEIILDRHFTFRRLEPHGMRKDFKHAALEVHGDLAVFYAIFNIWFNPILYMPMNFRAAVHHGHASTTPPKFQRRQC